ncbi:MAG: hypothetical protein RBQ97_01695 [Acholeplasma sp.]|nr:hypothetical protein [Acholeplasma sp.]
MKKKRNLFVFAIFLFTIMGFGAVSFAYWDTLKDVSAEQIEIGEGNIVSTTISLRKLVSNGTLVPVGYEGGSNFSEVIIVYNVLWEGIGASDVLGELNIDSKGFIINDEDFSHLFTIDIITKDLSITINEEKEVIMKVIFTNDTSDPYEYFKVSSQSISIKLDFLVEITEEDTI